ncbi:oxygen-dependent coproporphyrinogen oxidase [Olivibacter ginsenosidimutans]|uniref:coproporphyrinogen oxidase n=1 Tax=Olivibacter ginsenosidimutans TaxID=1176537 RepID=A0ABP9AGK8_9SPHI
MITKEEITAAYQRIQDDICKGLEAADGKALFEEERWEREGGGGGRTRIIQQGQVIERGGVNFSAVHGELPKKIKDAFQVENQDFFASGVSIVIHPKSPWVPIIHMNVRYFELDNGNYWFGGGIDLTPHYIIEKDASFFHQQLKSVCDRYDSSFYPRFKAWADDYFFIKHRNETRGVGGIFYDKLHAGNTALDKDHLFAFSKAVGESFVPIYTALIDRNKDRSFSEAEQQWQYIRRGRYVEFNLVYDAGTKFGLETNGRIESILMSLPPQANWFYNYQAKPGSLEDQTAQRLKKGIDWINA